jgi:acetyltransferase-like isoleucine patch superfamily enzyme
MDTFTPGQIHPTALVSENACLAENVTIGPFSIIYGNVHIGPNSVIGPHCILGEPAAAYYGNPGYQNAPLEIGGSALIRSGSILYAGSTLGDYLETGHRVTIRESTSAGAHLRIGTNSDVQGYCRIGEYARIHSSVHIGQFSAIGNYVWVFPYTVFTNDPHPPSENVSGVVIHDFAVIGANALLMPGIQVGTSALVGAGSVVYRDVPEGIAVAGNPARRIAQIDEIRDAATLEAAYPWPKRFDRGMPWKEIGFEAWNLQLSQGKEE